MNNPNSPRSSVKDPFAGQFLAAFVAAAFLGLTTALGADTGPTITSQPQSPPDQILVCTGFTISVTADGTPPLTYQWERNGIFLEDATNSSLTISNIQFSDSGVYVVQVANSVTNVWSNPAFLLIYRPSVTTQPASEIAPTSASLNSVTTPKSTNAVVSFNWGLDTSYGNSTSGTDVGNGIAPRSSKQRLSGLTPSTVYHYQAVASSAFGTAIGDDATFLTAKDLASGQNWTKTTAPDTNWSAIASSADGSKLVAAVLHGPIYTSTNSGTTWRLTSAPFFPWLSVASSADGSKLLAAASSDTNGNTFPVYISTNGGATWTATGSPSNVWHSVASSADGLKLVAVANVGSGLDSQSLYTSQDSGASWTAGIAPYRAWTCVASSADGNQLVTGAFYDGSIYSSTDSGSIWASNSVPGVYWQSVASSADGTRLVAATIVDGQVGPDFYPGRIYTSTNAGAIWPATGAPSNYWASVASSADGRKWVAAVQGGGVYTSPDSGSTWTSNSAPSTNWAAVVSSADGDKLAAVANGGGIYTWQSTPTPELSITHLDRKAILSWIIPSMNFTLQQNSELTTTNWTDVPTPPVLNLTNLQNQVMVAPTNSNAFFRLKH